MVSYSMFTKSKSLVRYPFIDSDVLKRMASDISTVLLNRFYNLAGFMNESHFMHTKEKYDHHQLNNNIIITIMNHV